MTCLLDGDRTDARQGLAVLVQKRRHVAHCKHFAARCHG